MMMIAFDIRSTQMMLILFFGFDTFPMVMIIYGIRSLDLEKDAEPKMPYSLHAESSSSVIIAKNNR